MKLGFWGCERWPKCGYRYWPPLPVPFPQLSLDIVSPQDFKVHMLALNYIVCKMYAILGFPQESKVRMFALGYTVLHNVCHPVAMLHLLRAVSICRTSQT